jgi:hypothetical protein
MAKKSVHSSEPGFSCFCINSLSGNENILYDAGVKEKPRWSLVCIAHAKNTQCKIKKTAVQLLKTPELWCSGCFELDDLKKAEKILNSSSNRPDDQQLRLWAKLAEGNPEKCAIFEKIYGLKPDLFW